MTEQTASVTATVDLVLDDQPLRMQLTVPAGPATPGQLLHLLRGLTDAVVDSAVEKSAAQDKPISCRKGCGACCRQLVPIAPTEAHRLRQLVDAMPEPRRNEVLDRFEAAHAKLAATGMLDRLRAPARMDEASRRKLGIDYFRHGVACPFLEQESCSIYAERPLACREYLVTSPAAHCAEPTPDSIDCLPIAARVSRALWKLEANQDRAGLSWVPLITAMEWAQVHPEAQPTSSGPAQIESLFKLLGTTQSTDKADA
ncbi:MAG TPA: YkgJ family cysteine cluster protein [Rhodanobacter sp.]|nr:YkgJ family cysteine cluster protein [Rhodanobacter sp.]